MRKESLYSLLLVPFLTGGNAFVSPSINTCNVATLVKPITALSNNTFHAVYDGNKVLLTWTSGQGEKTDYFTIEKARDGLRFSSTLMVKAAGFNVGSFDYKDIDYAPHTGISYYRLKCTNYEGKTSYSQVLPVNFQITKDGSMQPADGRTQGNVEIKKIEKKEVLVLVRDIAGNEYTAKVKVTKEKDEKLYAQDNQHSLNKGTYLVLASSYDALYSRRLIVR